MEELHREILSVLESELLLFKTREQVERRAVLLVVDAVDLIQPFGGRPSLFVEATARDQHLAGALAVDQSGGDDELGQGVAAKAHRRQLHHAFLDLVELALRSREDHPAAAEAADDVALGEPVEGDAGDVGRDRADGFVAKSVHHEPVVDLVREQNQMVLARDLRDRDQRIVGVDGARRVVRVDDQDRLGMRRDLRLDVVDIGVPMIVRVATVEHRSAAAEVGVVAPERVAGGRQKQLVVGADQRIHQHRRRFADAVADEDVVRHNALQAAPDMIGANDAPRRRHTAHVAVRDRLVDVERERLPHRVRQLEAEATGVTGIEFQDVRPFGFHAERFLIERAADVGMNVFESVGTMYHSIV